ncbi:family 78 glycoside hydrolase catalytic domain [Diplocloster hominis]|uniref:family 78 glycoside hydrolase catalytic domain n=1 Tax=Diplocloster hominis TaxID=3079010 RepID=UPI0031BA052D
MVKKEKGNLVKRGWGVKRFIAMALAFVMICVSMISNGGTLAKADENGNTAPSQPTDLKTEMLEYAYGLNTKNPAFSWVLHDADKDEIQTAYQIQVAKRSGDFNGGVLVHDTGKVESQESSFVHVDKLAELLEDNQLYYWRVKSWDRGQLESAWSEARPFMTDISSEWESMTGIWADPAATAGKSLWTDYNAEFTMGIDSGKALAVMVRIGQTSRDGYMLQFRGNGSEAGGEKNMIKFHKVNGGNVVTNTFAVLNLTDKGVSLPADNSAFGVSIKAQGSALTIGVKTDLAAGTYTEVGSVDISGQGDLTEGTIGFRTGGSESGVIDDLTVTALDGKDTILYQSDFSGDDGKFAGGCSVADGKLKVGKSTFSLFGGDLTTAGFGWLDYTVEETIQTTDNIYTLFRFANGKEAAYMYRVNPGTNEMGFYTRANSTSAPAHQGDVNLSGKVTLSADKPFRIKITVKGDSVNTWLDADASDGAESWVLVDADRDLAEFAYGAGYLGFRTDTAAAATVSDIKVTDASGNVQYQSDFTESNPFSDSSVKDGNLVIPGDLRSCAIYKPADAKLTNLGRYTFLRSPRLNFAKGKEIEKVIVSAACRGTGKDRGIIYDLYMNGVCLGAGSARELNNVGDSNYRQVYYNSYDVTELIAAGQDNVISAVGNSRDDARSILVQATAFYKDGSKEIICNSGKDRDSWKTFDGTNAFGDDGSGITTGYVTLMHDNYNANEYPTGWQEVEFDDSKWSTQHKTFEVATDKSGTQGNVLYPFSSENALRVVTDEPTKRVYQNTLGNVVIDLGKEVIGGLKVSLTSSTQQSVGVHMGEEMNGDGTVKNKMSSLQGGSYEDVWTLKKGVNAFETITMRNFRYVELIGLDDGTKAEILKEENKGWIKGWAIQQPFDENDSSFEATDGSDAATLMNRLYELSKYTIKATNQDLFVDSQARERAPYEGDLLVNSNTSYAVSDNYSLARHSNEWLVDNPQWCNDYKLFSVEMAYWDYIYTGNTDSLTEFYNALGRKLTTEVIEYEDSATGFIRPKGSQAGNSALIDWPTSERDGYQGSYYDVVLNSEYVGIYDRMASISEAVGNSGDAQTYREKSAKLKDNLIKYAYDETNGCFYDSLAQDYTPTRHSSTHATAYALTYGVFTDQEMADRLCQFVYNNCKDEFRGSVYVTYFILKGLYNGNHGEMAERLMTNPKVGTDVKTFASLLDDLNCTITPEAWGHKWKGNMTLSHPWGAAPGCSIVQGMFGILPTKAGFDEFAIKLQPGDISSASIKAPTVKGPITVSVENAGEEGIRTNQMKAVVTIPVNSKAKVYMPVEDNLLTYLDIDGVKTDGIKEDGYLAVELGSGTYTVSVNPEKPDYEPVLTMTLSVESDKLTVEDETIVKAVVKDQYNNNRTENSAFTYKSNDENILTVDETGKITAVRRGDTTVEVTAEYKYSESKSATVTGTVNVHVDAVLKNFALKLDSGNDAVETGETVKASMAAVYNDGQEEILDNTKVTYTAEGDAATVNSAGLITGVKEGTVTVKADIRDKFTKINAKMEPVPVMTRKAWSFDGVNSPLSNVAVKDGALHAGLGQKVINTDADKQGSVFSGTFSVENVAASIAFNVKDDNNRYFWQFRTDNTLKKHKGNADLMEVIPIQLEEGDNTFLIATIDGVIYTYLNGKLIDICGADPGMPVSGGFGVRNGNSESFYLKEMNVGSDPAFRIESTLKIQNPLPTVTSVQNPKDITVDLGTTLEELNLPSEVDITLDNGQTVKAEVNWTGIYDGNAEATYTLTGTLTASDTFKNPDGVTAELKVTVKKSAPKVISVQESSYETVVGTDWESLSLPGEVTVTLSDNTTKDIPVTWQKGDYDKDTVGDYTVSGDLTVDEGYENPDNIRAQITISVKSPDLPKVVLVQTFGKLEVAFGTAREDLELPATAEITLNDEASTIKTAAISWSGAYDGNTAGDYTLTGSLADSEEYTNTDNLTAEIVVTVKQGLPVIRSVKAIPDKEVPHGTAAEELELPLTIEVTYEDTTTQELCVTWSGDYDGNVAGEYLLTGTLETDGICTNPNDIKAAVKIVVQEKAAEPTPTPVPTPTPTATPVPTPAPTVTPVPTPTPIPSEKPDDIIRITDSETGVTVQANPGIVPKDVQLKVVPENSGEVYEQLKASVKNTAGKEQKQVLVYDITLYSGGVEIQPDGAVKVTIPLPEGTDSKNILLYHVKADKQLEKVDFTVEGNSIIFYASSFSKYIIAENKADADDHNNSGNNDSQNQNSSSDDNSTVKGAQTGDNGMLYETMLLMLGAIMIIGTLCYRNRAKRSGHR